MVDVVIYGTLLVRGSLDLLVFQMLLQRYEVRDFLFYISEYEYRLLLNPGWLSDQAHSVYSKLS